MPQRPTAKTRTANSSPVQRGGVERVMELIAESGRCFSAYDLCSGKRPAGRPCCGSIVCPLTPAGRRKCAVVFVFQAGNIVFVREAGREKRRNQRSKGPHERWAHETHLIRLLRQLPARSRSPRKNERGCSWFADKPQEQWKSKERERFKQKTTRRRKTFLIEKWSQKEGAL